MSADKKTSKVTTDWKDRKEEAFEAGVRHGFNNWEVMILALNQGWGGQNAKQKKEMMIEEVLAHFHKKKDGAYPQEVEDMLSDAIGSHFSVDCQDGSAQWLSRLFCQLWNDVARQDYTGLNEFLSQHSESVVNEDGMTLEEYDEDDEDWDPEEDDEFTDTDFEHSDEAEIAPNEVADLLQEQGEEKTMEPNTETDNTDNDADDGWTTVPAKGKKKKKK